MNDLISKISLILLLYAALLTQDRDDKKIKDLYKRVNILESKLHAESRRSLDNDRT